MMNPTHSPIRFRLVVLAAALAVSPAPAQPPGMPPSPVAVAPVVERQVAAGQTFVGTVRPSRTSAVGSAVDGRVEEFLVNEGDRVTKGQPLAKLRTKTLELERDAAKAELDVRLHELAELEHGMRPEEIAHARAGVAAAEARAKYTEARFKRMKDLFAAGRGGAVSEEELQLVTHEHQQALQLVLQAKASYDMAVQGPRKEKIDQARAKVATQEDVVRRLEDQINLHTVRAPFDGYVSAEHTEAGQWVTRGGLVAEVVELDEVEVEANVNEESIGHLSLGAEARVEVGALADRVFVGTVARVVPQANVRARTFPVKVRVRNEVRDGTPLLKSNMFARVTLAVGKPEQATLVPKDAVVLGGPQPLVFVPEPGADGKTAVTPVPVELGVASGPYIQVKGALKAGQRVIVQGNERLRPGQPVAVVREVEPPAGATKAP
jgi:RND family efflux transporter MFP subunit